MRSTVGGVVSLAAGAFVMTVLVSSCSGSSSDPQTSASGSAATGEPGLLVSESNGAQNNEILVYQLGGDGSVAASERVSTGQAGTGDYLHTSYAVASLTPSRVLAVNAGASTVSVLDRSGDSVTQTALFPTGGRVPASVATHGGTTAYVLSTGMPIVGDGSKSRRIAGPVIERFRIADDGSGTPIGGARLDLPGACSSYPCRSSVVYGGMVMTPDGGSIVLSESSRNQVRTIAVAPDGSIGDSTVTASAIEGPFGSAVTPQGVVAIAGHTLPDVAGALMAGAVRDGRLQVDEPEVPMAYSNTCWVVASPDGSVFYSMDAGFDKPSQKLGVTSLRVDDRGKLTRIGATTLPWDAIEFPNDGVVTPDGRYLYSKALQGVYAFDIDEQGAAAYAPAKSVFPDPKVEGPTGMAYVAAG